MFKSQEVLTTLLKRFDFRVTVEHIATNCLLHLPDLVSEMKITSFFSFDEYQQL